MAVYNWSGLGSKTEYLHVNMSRYPVGNMFGSSTLPVVEGSPGNKLKVSLYNLKLDDNKTHRLYGDIIFIAQMNFGLVMKEVGQKKTREAI